MQLRLRMNPIRSTNELRSAYNVLYESGALKQIKSFYLWALSLLKPIPGAKLLDISCGRGDFLEVADKEGIIALGVDISDAAVREARARGLRFVVIADGEALPFPEAAFEYVTNLGSIEHYLHPERGIAEIARVLTTDGKACILLPNSYSLLENIWRVFLTGDVADQGQPIERYATRAQWERMLSENGLEVYKTIGYNWPVPRTLSDWGWYIRRPRRLLWLILSALVPLNLSGCFAFLCKVRHKC